MLGLAYMFAVAKYRSCPIYMLDEVDAALGANIITTAQLTKI